MDADGSFLSPNDPRWPAAPVLPDHDVKLDRDRRSTSKDKPCTILGHVSHQTVHCAASIIVRDLSPDVGAAPRKSPSLFHHRSPIGAQSVPQLVQEAKDRPVPSQAAVSCTDQKMMPAIFSLRSTTGLPKASTRSI